MMYYSQRKSILNGEPQTINNRFGNQREMERQFHLYCANACDSVAEEEYQPSISPASTTRLKAS